jgi:CHAD domain-containing protein
VDLEASLQSALLTEMQGTTDGSTREQTVRELCDQFNVDMEHAKRVASNAVNLLKLLHEIHPMPVHLSPFLETAALLHDIGSNVKVDKHHNYGRDLILQHRLDGFTREQRSLIAFLISLHRKNIKTKRIEKQLRKTNLAPTDGAMAVQLAAILRVADGLDTTHSQTTELVTIRNDGYSYLIEITGPRAKREGGRALQKSDLWTYAFESPLSLLIADQKILLPGSRWFGLNIPAQSLTTIDLEPTDRLVDAGREIIAFHLIRMLQNEPGVYKGDNVEAVHDMRVATRRIRTAIKVLAPYFPTDWRETIKEELRNAAKILGEVRDLDVFKINFDDYIQDQSSWKMEAYANLIRTWESEHSAAHQKVKSYLDGEAYRNCVAKLANFQNKFVKYIKDIPDEIVAERINQSVPSILFKLDKQVRVYDNQLDTATLHQLHRLRIQLKHFRYTLEFFDSVLGETNQLFISEIINLQDHLGNLHDADFSCRFVEKEINELDPDQIHNRAMLQYVAYLKQHIENLQKSFHIAWSDFYLSENHQLLASVIRVL